MGLSGVGFAVTVAVTVAVAVTVFVAVALGDAPAPEQAAVAVRTNMATMHPPISFMLSTLANHAAPRWESVHSTGQPRRGLVDWSGRASQAV